jgi:peptidyl-prolyl cis-trans isomerase SurA
VQGGDLGWRRPDDLPSLFAEHVPTLSPGQVSEPIRSPSGFHILHLIQTRGTGEVIQQTRARHILLKASAIRSEEQTQALAAELRQRALDGASFADLARQYSEDIGSAMEGGELGWTSPGQLVGEFQKAMDATREGAISEPFRSQYGWHIVQVEKRRQQDVTDDIRRNIARNYLHQRKFQDELDAWLQKIRDEAYVDIKRS